MARCVTLRGWKTGMTYTVPAYVILIFIHCVL